VETHPKENRRPFIQTTFGLALFPPRGLFPETLTQTSSLTEELTAKFDIVMGR
jgi:hypothetical protein